MPVLNLSIIYMFLSFYQNTINIDYHTILNQKYVFFMHFFQENFENNFFLNFQNRKNYQIYIIVQIHNFENIYL